MLTKRIIPCLDVHNGRVVKGVNFVNLRDAGDPVEIAAAYDRAGADELVKSCLRIRSTVRGWERGCWELRVTGSSLPAEGTSGEHWRVRTVHSVIQVPRSS